MRATRSDVTHVAMRAAITVDHVGMESRAGHRALRRGRVSLPHQIYHLTIPTRDRVPFFVDFATACAAASCFERKALLGDAQMLAWVLMPDHAHWLLQLGESAGLIATVSRLKSASSRAANKTLGRNGHLWSSAFHDRALRRDEDVMTVARYIIANPIRAGLVERVSDYTFWDAVWL